MPRVKEILKKVKKLDIKTNKLVEGLIAGNYHSVFKGRGIEFSEVREYVPGDDIRSIDWNVTARFNSPFIKEFIEERDLNVYIVFDISGSSRFGSKKSKKEVGFEIAASIMFAALKNNDNVGLCLFTDHVEKFIKPKKSKKFILKILRELIYYEPKNEKTDINKSLTYLSRIIKKKSILFVLSDFISADFESSIKILKNKHDIILINLSDIHEKDLPNLGYIFLEDEESGEQIIVNTGDEKFRKIYSQKIREKNNKMLTTIKRLGIDMIQINTNEPFYIPLRKFFRLRKRRMVR